MKNPHVPAVHMNTRMIVTTAKLVRRRRRSQSHAGRGAQRTIIPTRMDFHARLKAACDAFDPGWYAKYKKWADEYFWLPHRGEPRGVGGIFYDHHDSGDWDKDFAFTQSGGRSLSRHLSRRS